MKTLGSRSLEDVTASASSKFRVVLGVGCSGSGRQSRVRSFGYFTVSDVGSTVLTKFLVQGTCLCPSSSVL